MTTEATPAAPTPNDPAKVKEAIELGLKTLSEGASKADAARAIFNLIHSEPREVVLKAFIDGATITLKGAPTYFYNISRKFKRDNGVTPSKKRK